MSNINKIKAVWVAAPTAFVKHLSPHDTSAPNQCAIVMEALQTGPKNTIQLKDEFSVMAPAARIAELRKTSKIVTKRVRVRTQDGVWHRGVAQYFLLPGGVS